MFLSLLYFLHTSSLLIFFSIFLFLILSFFDCYMFYLPCLPSTHHFFILPRSLSRYSLICSPYLLSTYSVTYFFSNFFPSFFFSLSLTLTLSFFSPSHFFIMLLSSLLSPLFPSSLSLHIFPCLRHHPLSSPQLSSFPFISLFRPLIFFSPRGFSSVVAPFLLSLVSLLCLPPRAGRVKKGIFSCTNEQTTYVSI